MFFRSFITKFNKVTLQTSSAFISLSQYRVALHKKPLSCFSNTNKYQNKTSRDIELEVARQKMKNTKNTYKALDTSFGMLMPSEDMLKNSNYKKPQKIDYDLETLRKCSKEYPVYLYWELKKEKSHFHEVIEKLLQNLWKAQKKQALELVAFLRAWKYSKVDVDSLYKRSVQKFDMSFHELFQSLKLMNTSIQQLVQMKMLIKMRDQNISSDEYGAIMRIINYMTFKETLNDKFFYAISKLIKSNINSITPKNALEAYIYFTYNQGQLPEEPLVAYSEGKGQSQNEQKTRENFSEQSNDIVKIIESRIFSPQCLKFYNPQELIAVIITFLKNSILRGENYSDGTGHSQYFQRNIDKLVTRVQLLFVSQDVNNQDKIKLLQLVYQMPLIKRQIIIAILLKDFSKKSNRFSPKLLVELYLAAHQNNLMIEHTEIIKSLQNSIVENINQLESSDVSRVAWLFTVTSAHNINILHKKIQSMIDGGLRDYSIKEVCIFVWSMSAVSYKKDALFWQNIESYIGEQLFREFNRVFKNVYNIQDTTDKHKSEQYNAQNQQDQIQKNDINTDKNQLNSQTNLKRLKAKQQRKLTNQSIISDCSWILWAYLNNRPLSLRTLDIITTIIIQCIGITNSDTNTETQSDCAYTLTKFELVNIVSFYYSVELPSKTITQQINRICLLQFIRLYRSMQCAQLCKVLKFMGWQVWPDKQLTSGVVEVFEAETDGIGYNDIMGVIGVLLGSGVQGSRIRKLIIKLSERKKRLQSVETISEVSK